MALDNNEFNRILGFDESMNIQQNKGIGGDVVDLAQKGIYDTAGSALDFVGADDLAKSIYKRSEEQMQTLTPEMQRAMQQQIFTEDEQGNLQVGEGAGNWRTWVGNTAQLAGQYVPQLAVGGTAGLLGKAVGASGAALTTIQAGAGGVFGGASANALAGKSAYEGVDQMDWDTLSQSKLFQEVVKKKYQESPDADPVMLLDDAKEEVAQFVRDNVTYDPTLFAINSALDAVGDKFLVDGILNKMGSTVRGATAKGALSEGLTEGAQGGYEQYTSNVAQQQADPTINPMAGVKSGALTEGVLGGAIGGAAGGVGRAIGGAPRESGQPNADNEQSDAQKGDVNPTASNDLTKQPDLDLPAYERAGIQFRMDGENIPLNTSPTPEELIQQQMAGGIQYPLDATEQPQESSFEEGIFQAQQEAQARDQNLQPLYTQKPAPEGLNEQQQLDYYRDRDRQFGTLGDNAQLGQTPKSAAKRIKKRLAQEGTIEATPVGGKPKQQTEFGAQPNQAMAEAFKQAQQTTEESNTNVALSDETLQESTNQAPTQPSKVTPAQKRNNAAIALNLPQKKSKEKAADYEKRIDRAQQHYDDVTAAIEDQSFDDLTRDELATIAKDVDVKVLKKDSRKSLRQKIRDWQGTVANKAESRQQLEAQQQKIGTKISNGENINIVDLKKWQQSHATATANRAKENDVINIPDIYSKGDVQVSQALGLDYVPAPNSEERNNSAYRDMDELLTAAEDGGDINQFIDDAGIRDQAEKFLINGEGTLNPFDGDMGITEALGLPRDSGVRRLVATSIYLRKDDILGRMDKAKLAEMRAKRKEQKAVDLENTKRSVATSQTNRERENAIVDNAASVENLNDAIDTVGEYQYDPVTSAVNIAMEKFGLTKEQAIERNKRIKQRGMIDTISGKRLSVDDTEALRRQWDSEDFSQDPVKQAKEFLASREKGNTYVAPLKTRTREQQVRNLSYAISTNPPKDQGNVDEYLRDIAANRYLTEPEEVTDEELSIAREAYEGNREAKTYFPTGSNTQVLPMQEYDWGDGKVRYNDSTGVFEQHLSDDRWGEISKRLVNRFLNDRKLSAPEGYSTTKKESAAVEDAYTAEQFEAEKAANAEREKKAEQSEKRRQQKIKKQQGEEQVGTFNDADAAMAYARQWALTETHYPDEAGMTGRRKGKKDWTLRKMPTEKLPNDYVSTLFRDPIGKWGNRYFITGDNLQALKPYAAQHWGGKDFKFQLAPKWALDRGVDLAKSDNVLNVPRDPEFLVKLQDAGSYIETDDYSAMDAMGLARESNTEVTPEDAEIDRQLKEGIEVTMSPSGKIKEAPNAKVRPNFTGTDLQEAARLTVSGYRLAEQNMEVWKHQRWLGELDSNLNRVVRERGGEGNFSQNDLGKTIGVTTENMQELRKVIESEGTQGDIVLARKLFPETARKRDAGEKIQLKPYFPQYVPRTERPNTPEIGDAMVVVSANNPRGVKRKYSTADRFYVESVDGGVVTAVSRFDNDKIKLKKASDTTWNVVSRSENLKVVASLEKASPTRETSREDLRKRWMAENAPEQEASAPSATKPMSKKTKSDLDRKIVKYNRRVDAFDEAAKNLDDVMATEGYNGKKQDAGKSNNLKVRNAFKKYDKAFNEENAVEGEIKALYKRFINEENGSKSEWDSELESFVDIFSSEDFDTYGEPERNTNVLPDNSTFPAQEGDEATVYTSNGTEVPVRYKVVEASELQTSNNTDFSVNENFPEELQPRDRSSAALQQQVREIASDLKPERLAESSEADRGAPIVRDGVVESGNGRTIAIKMAYEQGNGKKYKKWLSDHQNRFGIEGVDLFKQPVLVRERLGDMDSREFVVAANEQATAELSTLEQAQVDAGRLTDADLDLINIPDNGDMLSASNHRFMQRFIQRLGTAQSSGLTTADGTFNKAAGERALNAVFHKAYNNDMLTQMVAEESSPDVKNVLTALTRSAPSMVSLQTYEQGDIGLSDALADATMTVRQSRKNNQSVDELVGQSDIFSERNPIGDKLAKFMDKNIRSAKRMGDVFTSLAKQIETSHKRSQTVDMFGDSGEVSITDVLQSNTEFVNANTESQAAQGTLDLQQGSKPVRPVSKQSNQPSKPQEKQRAETEAVAKDYGKENKIFTEDAAAKARALLRSRLGTVNSGIDPEIVQAGITLAGYHIEAGARKFNEYASAMIQDLGDVAKPYLRSWYEGVRYYPGVDSEGMSTASEIDAINIDKLGKQDVPSTEFDTERDSRKSEREVRESGLSESIPPKRTTEASSTIDTARRADEKRDERTFSDSVSENQPDSDGAGSDSELYSSDGSARIKERVTRPSQSERSHRDNGQRNVVNTEGEISTSATPEGAIPSREERVKLQAKAESKPSKAANLDNIRETLPILLPEQQEDVQFAEQRFSAKGHGVHFANGTGTGKTFSGLGIVKRHQREGKNNVLIVTPSNEINKEWFNAAPMFNMEIKALENKQDAGEGIVITTYANFRDNWAIGTRDWDAVVMDESHNLLQKDSTEPTTALVTLRAITGHPKGESRLNMLLNPEFGKPYSELQNQLQKVQTKIDALEETGPRGKKPVLNQQEKAELSNLKSQAETIKGKMKPLAEKLAKTLPKSQEIARKRWSQNKTNTVMLSATPWSYRKSVSLSEGFLFDYPDVPPSGAYNAPDSQQQFFMDTFGYEMKNNKLNEPDAKVDTGLLEREFNESLKEAGSLRARMLEVEYDYDRKFELIDGGIGTRIDAGFAYLRDKVRSIRKATDGLARDSEEYNAAQERIRGWDSLYSMLNSSFDYQQQIYLLEAIKAKAAIPYIRKHLAKGRKVVVFHGYNKGLEPNIETGERIAYRPFTLDENSVEQGVYDAWQEFQRERPDLANLEITDLSKPIDTFQREFTKELALVNGTVSRKVAQQGIQKFNEDGSGTDVILVQQDKGSAGISLHDKTGKHQRVLINLGIPVKPTQSIQIEGRIYRVNLMSDAMFRYFNTGLNFERRMFASRMATRAGTTENLAMGNQARALKDNMVEAFEDSQDWGVGFAGEGTGGKTSDRERNTEVTQWDIAKTFYYKQQKKNARTKAQEGTDYFATPEPVGLKLVEWLSLNKGDKVLEPSAGHGAVSRWFPDGTFGHIVEPSSSLFPRAQMATNSLDKAHNMTFEEFGTNNKFNGIAMNPPYGKGGKVAMEHVAKAFMHLRRGGRITAVVPNGPAFDKRFNAWLASEKNANHIATVKLPSSTFGRAGTSVNTKVLVIDYVPSNIPRTLGHSEIDLSHSKDVADLFDNLEDVSLPPRQEIADIDVEEVMSDAGLKVKKRPKSKARPARWSVSGSGTYRYKEAIKASASSEENKPRWNRADSAWEFPEENGNPSEAIADNVMKVQRGEDLPDIVMFRREADETITKLGKDKLSVDEVKRKAVEFVSKFKHLNIKEDDIMVAEKPSDLYGERGTYLDGTTKGAYNQSTGQLHLFSGEVSGDTSVRMSEDLRATLTHELLVHKGIDVFTNHQIETLFNEILASAKTSKDFANLVNSTLKSYPSGAFGESVFIDPTNPTLDNLTPDGRKLIAEEMFAAISESANENTLQNPTNLPSRVVNAIKQMVRKLLIKAGLTRYVTRSMFLPEVYRIANLLNNDVLPRRSDGSARYQGTMRRSVSNEQAAREARLNAKFAAPDTDNYPVLSKLANEFKKLRINPRERVAYWWEKAGTILRQKVVDQYDSLRRLDQMVMEDGDEYNNASMSSWVLAKMASSAVGAIEATMTYGRVRYDDATKTIVPISKNDKSGGLIGLLQSLGDENEVNQFLRWIAAERANNINKKAEAATKRSREIKARIRELNDSIDSTAWDSGNAMATMQLQEMRAEIDYLNRELKSTEKATEVVERFYTGQELEDGLAMVDGLDHQGKPRRAKWEATQKQFAKYQNDIVGIGVKTGVIKPADAEMWRDQFYLPFYRVMDEVDSNGIPLRASGLSRQAFEQKYKGSARQMDDLLNNVVKNHQAIMTQGLKNQAAVQAMDNGLSAGIVEETTEYKRDKKSSTFVMRDGEKVWYNIHDPLLFEAVSSLDPATTKLFGMETASKFKRAFTDIISMSPSFIARNFMRDTFQSKTMAATDLVEGVNYMRKTLGKMDYDKALMLTTGASFTFTNQYAETSVEREFGAKNVIGGNDTANEMASKARKALNTYRGYANAVENANRYATFQQAQKEGANYLQAAFMARDLMDFGSRGSSTLVRGLVSIVPFLNARIQGLDKLGRASGLYNALNMKTPNATEAQQRKRFIMVTALLACATAVLHAVNVGDDEAEEKYRRLSDEERDANWFVGGFKIPKPQELGGFVFSPIERMMDAIVYDRAQDGATQAYIYRTLSNTFSFNPTPQIIKPLIEVYFNENMYTGRAIEYTWEQKRSPNLIYDYRSSELAKSTSNVMTSVIGDGALSPKQLDHLVYGYTGWLGTTVLSAVDSIVNGFSSNPNPSYSLGSNSFVRSFYSGNEPRYTADQKRLYDLTQQFHRDYNDYKTLIKLDRPEEARELLKKKGEKIRLSRMLLKVQRQIQNLNKVKERIRRDSSLSSQQKRDQIDQASYQQEKISKNVIARLNSLGIR